MQIVAQPNFFLFFIFVVVRILESLGNGSGIAFRPERDGLLAEDPTGFVETVRQRSDNSRRPFNIAKLKTVFDACDDEWKSLVMFGLYTGQRLSDVAALTWQNVDPEKGEVRFVTPKDGEGANPPDGIPLGASMPAGEEP